MGVSFEIDFSGSSNLVILPPAAPPTTDKPPSMPATNSGKVGPAQQRPSTSSTSVVADTGLGDIAEGKEGDCNSSSVGGTPKIMARDEAAGGRNDEKREAAAGGRSGEAVEGMSFRVSTGAFCRTVVARVTIRDPNVGGTIKTSCSWELLEPPSPPPPPPSPRASAAGSNNNTAAGIRQQLLTAQSLGLAGDADDGGVGRRAKSRSEEIVKRCCMHGALYVDPEFPPNDSSLGPSLAATGILTWRRPSQFPGVGAAAAYTGATAAFGGCGRPLPSDVRPCSFAADASLACALAALAERPLLVSSALCGRVEETAARPSASSIGSGGGSGRSVDDEAESSPCLENGHLCRGKNEGGKGCEAIRRVPPKQGTAVVAAAEDFAAAARSGMFSARLCVHGVWKEYVLDDFFPCLTGDSCGGGGPCLSRAHGPALWVSMLEKAYARAMGSYSAALKGLCLSSGSSAGVAGKGQEAIGAGGTGVAAAGVVARPAEVLGVFTGAPVLQVQVGSEKGEVRRAEGMASEAAVERARGVEEGQDKRDQEADELWGNIVSWVQQGGLVCLSTPPAGKPRQGQHDGGGGGRSWKNGLRLGHAYTVLRTATVGRGDDIANRLLRLRGPLPAKEGWRGEWADDSPRWTPEALHSLQATTEAAGMTVRYTGLSMPGDQTFPREEEEKGGQAFWVSMVEAVSSFVEVGVCFAPSPGPMMSLAAVAAGGTDLRRKSGKNGASGSWVQEARRRVVLRRRRDALGRGGSRSTAAAAALRRGGGAAETGRNRGKDGNEGAGWAASQLYALSVYQTSRMFFSLHQEKRAGEPEEPLYRDAGVTVLCRGEGGELKAIASTGNPAKAAVSAGAVLTPGRYVVVPTCTGCLCCREDGSKSPSAGGAKDRDHASETRADGKPVGEGVDMNGGGEGPSATGEHETEEGRDGDGGEDKGGDGERSASSFDRPDVLAALGDMFDGLDADCDGVLSREELDAYLRTTEGLPLQDDVFTWLMRMFSSCPRPAPVQNDVSRCQHRRYPPGGRGTGDCWGRKAPAGVEDSGYQGAGGAHGPLELDLCLTRRGFVDMYRCIWQAAGRDLQLVTRDLRLAGCIDRGAPVSDGDPLPRSTEDRFPVVISVHSDTGFDFVAQPSDPEVIEAALTLPVQRWGYCCYQTPPLSGLENAPPSELVEQSKISAVSTTNTANDNNTNNNGVLMLHVRPGPKGAKSAVTFAAKSLVARGGGAVRARLDCAGSLNARPLPGSIGLSREVTLLPGESKVIQHLVPADPRQPWTWRHSPLMAEGPAGR
eukprot:g13456.t1